MYSTVFRNEKAVELVRMFKKILLVGHYASLWVRITLIVSKIRINQFWQNFGLYHFRAQKITRLSHMFVKFRLVGLFWVTMGQANFIYKTARAILTDFWFLPFSVLIRTLIWITCITHAKVQREWNRENIISSWIQC